MTLQGVAHAVNLPQGSEENPRNSTPEAGQLLLRFKPSVLVLCLQLRFVVLFRFVASVDAQISLGAVRKTSRETVR
jgi:hypothetical protein